MQSDDPPSLLVGSNISAKFKGAFCEAKVKHIVRSVKCKVTLKDNTTVVLDDSSISGEVRLGANVLVPASDRTLTPGTIVHVKDASIYTVLFNDGDERTLKRAQICVNNAARETSVSDAASGLMSSSLSNKFDSPLDGPGGNGGSRNRSAAIDSSDNDSSQGKSGSPASSTHSIVAGVVSIPASGSKSSSGLAKGGLVVTTSRTSVLTKSANSPRASQPPPPTQSRGGNNKMPLGTVVGVFEDKERKRYFPAMVVSPRAQPTLQVRVREEYLVRSFRDGRYLVINKKSVFKLVPEDSKKVEGTTLFKASVEKALAYLERNELPSHWDRELLLKEPSQSSSSENDGDSSDDNDEKASEERDRFVAHLYKFMDERNTPIKRTPTIAGHEMNLYKFYCIVASLGGFNKVCNNNSWKEVLVRLKLDKSGASAQSIKQAYAKYLNSFDSFYRKLGCLMGEFSREPKQRKSSSRSVLPAAERLKHDSGNKSKTDQGSTSSGGQKAAAKTGGANRLNNAQSAAARQRQGPEHHRLMRGSSLAAAKKRYSAAVSLSVSKAKRLLTHGNSIGGPDHSLGRRSRSSPRIDGLGCSRVEVQESPGGDSRVRRESAGSGTVGGICHDKWVQLAQEGTMKVGQMVRVKYGIRSHKNLYNARLQRIEAKGVNRRYFVHYFGWNIRYDEYVLRNRIVERPVSAADQEEELEIDTTNATPPNRGNGEFVDIENMGRVDFNDVSAVAIQSAEEQKSGPLSSPAHAGRRRKFMSETQSTPTSLDSAKSARADLPEFMALDSSVCTRNSSKNNESSPLFSIEMSTKRQRSVQSSASANIPVESSSASKSLRSSVKRARNYSASANASVASSNGDNRSDTGSSEEESIAGSWSVKETPQNTPFYDSGPSQQRDRDGDLGDCLDLEPSLSIRSRSTDRESVITPTRNGSRRSLRLQATSNSNSRLEGSTDVGRLGEVPSATSRMNDDTECDESDATPSSPPWATPQSLSLKENSCLDNYDYRSRLTTSPFQSRTDIENDILLAEETEPVDSDYYGQVKIKPSEKLTGEHIIATSASWRSLDDSCRARGSFVTKQQHSEATVEIKPSQLNESNSAKTSKDEGKLVQNDSPRPPPKLAPSKPKRRARRRRYSHMMPSGGRKVTAANRAPKPRPASQTPGNDPSTSGGARLNAGADSDDDDDDEDDDYDNDDEPGKKEQDSATSSKFSSTAVLKNRLIQSMSLEPTDTKYTFDQIDDKIRGEERAQLILHRMNEIREVYAKVKADLARLDRKRKKNMEKRKELIKKAHTSNFVCDR